LTAMAAAIALDRPKKQRVRMLKAACATDSCGYTVRVAASWVRDVGPPHCPQHGAMSVDCRQNPTTNRAPRRNRERAFKRSLSGAEIKGPLIVS
jgi:hypothetical protein